MKKTLLTILTSTLLISPALSFSQTNSYLQNNPVWQVASACVLPPTPNCAQYESYNYYTNGDTAIKALIYKKIFRKGQGTYSPKFPGAPVTCPAAYHYTNSAASFFLRSAGKKMFLRVLNDTNEYLLYDFNLYVGDTLPKTYNNSLTITVTAIDSIATSYGYRHRFHLSTNQPVQYLVEGVGHSNGLVEPMGIVFDCGYKLNCYSINDTAYFPVTGPTCDILVGITSHKVVHSTAVFPNPFATEAIMYFDGNLHNAQLNIYNQYGQKVRSIGGLSGDKVKVKREELCPGVYLYEVIEPEARIVTGKLVISD